MSPFQLSPIALADIDEIATSLAATSLDAAAHFIEDIYKTFAFLARHPHVGHRRTDLTNQPVFFWTIRKTYAVIYLKSDPIAIVHVRRWRQDLVRLLETMED